HAGYRCESSANKVPVYFTAIAVEIAKGEVAFGLDLGGRQGAFARVQAVEPADCGVVVVRARVDDQVSNVIGGFEKIGRQFVAKSELQNAHAWEPPVFAKRLDFRCDEAEVFRNDRKFSQRSFERGKEAGSRALHPAAGLGGSCRCRDLVIFFETSEVIQPYDIYHF